MHEFVCMHILQRLQRDRAEGKGRSIVSLPMVEATFFLSVGVTSER